VVDIARHMDARPRSDQVDKHFVVISGLPGSGKTTVARALAPLLHLLLIDKDDILDRLFETRGIGDAAWRRTLSRESDRMLEHDARASDGAILVSFWHTPGMPEDSGTPADWLAQLSASLVHVHCACEPELAARRFIARTRHPGHLDASRSPDEIAGSIRALALAPALQIGSRIDVDTAVALDPQQLASTISRSWS
jgi:adenylate kinase